MFETQRKVLVTGGAGFTGSHLLRRLLQAGHEVRTLVRDPQKLQRHEDDQLDVVVGDVRDPEICRQAVQDCDVVYHIAASFRSGKASAAELIETNAEGTTNMLNAAEAVGVSRFVHCSTIGVLGHIEAPPATEDTPYNPCDDYQYSKMLGEKIVLDYAQQGRVPATVVRPASIYGEGDLRLLKLFRSIKKGLFVMVGSGDPHFHMVHVDDLATGFMLAASSDAAVEQVYIIAGDRSVALKDLARIIAEVLHAAPPRLHVPYNLMWAAGAAFELICKPFHMDPPIYRRRVSFFHHNRSFDIRKAKEELGYQPQVDLLEGIRRTANWYASEGLL